MRRFPYHEASVPGMPYRPGKHVDQVMADVAFERRLLQKATLRAASRPGTVYVPHELHRRREGAPNYDGLVCQDCQAMFVHARGRCHTCYQREYARRQERMETATSD